MALSSVCFVGCTDIWGFTAWQTCVLPFVYLQRPLKFCTCVENVLCYPLCSCHTALSSRLQTRSWDAGRTLRLDLFQGRITWPLVINEGIFIQSVSYLRARCWVSSRPKHARVWEGEPENMQTPIHKSPPSRWELIWGPRRCEASALTTEARGDTWHLHFSLRTECTPTDEHAGNRWLSGHRRYAVPWQCEGVYWSFFFITVKTESLNRAVSLCWMLTSAA